MDIQQRQLRSIAIRKGFGQHKVVCPFCDHERKKRNMADMSLNVDDERACYMCHHCGETGAVSMRDEAPIKKPEAPKVKRAVLPPAEPKNEVVAYMEARGISEATIEKCGIEQATRWFRKHQKELPAVMFPYKDRNGKPYSAKFRTADAEIDKDFSAEGTPMSLWLADQIEDWSEVVVCEGEMDAASCVEAGIKNPTSIPNGAFDKRAKNIEYKLRYCDIHADALEDTERVVLAFDDDEPGHLTMSEVARRFGKERCWIAQYPEGCKDLNEVLQKHGVQGVKDAISSAVPFPIEGAVSDKDAIEEARILRVSGTPKGIRTGLVAVDHIYSIVPGRLTVVTGHPGSGKSQWVDQIVVNLAQHEGHRTGIIGFENDVGSHFNELAHMWLGKPTYAGRYGAASEYEAKRAEKFISTHFKWAAVDSEIPFTLDHILSIGKGWVRRFGIRDLVIDPFNYIVRNKSGDQSDTDWISEMLSRVKRFAMAHNVHVFFVAHPTKMSKNSDGQLPVPTGYDISGSAAWFAKADLGVTVHRPDPGIPNEMTEVHVWKAKRSWMGKVGQAELWYSPDAHQYVDVGMTPMVKRLVDPSDVPF